MPDLRDRGLRWAVAGVVLVLALLDVQGLVRTLRAQGRQRERVARATWEAVAAVRSRVQERVAAENGPSSAMADEALRATRCQEFELFDASGRRLFSHPTTAPVDHRLDSDAQRQVIAGEPLTFGPVFGREPRLLTYVGLQVGGAPAIGRFARAVPEVAEDLQERRELILGHAVSLALLAMLGALALLPHRAERDAPPPARALDAYEQAMGRLRERRVALEQQIRDAAPFVRAGELTSGMAHEVRNGLGTIVGYARLIERGVAAEEAGDAAKSIREECEALEAVVRRFVEFVKQEELRLAPFEAQRLLIRVAAREERQRPGARVEVRPGEVTLVADEELLERAVENLVRNARDAAGPDGHVTLSAAAEREQARIVVEDDGPGLSQAQRDALRPFVTTKPGGLGLGLAIVHKIASLHGGRVLMGDRVPRGLAVTLTLPAPKVDGSVTPGNGPTGGVAPAI
ncbi:MAG TPA: HAMP domain-containing sensor histidine kinase [Vicinamibacteria bacterium]|nr:HAMP domain-containing sensor histidine kinase [Vicinamibacteria bacterium]